MKGETTQSLVDSQRCTLSGFQKELGDLLKSFDKVLVPEMNTGQFKTVLRDKYLVDAQALTKTSGQPFQIAELEAEIAKFFDDTPGNEGGQVPANDQQLPSTEV